MNVGCTAWAFTFPGYQAPPITQNGDGLTADDHFPGHGG